MVKYTHLIERCSSFLKIGAAWRLKKHGYTFSEAYWRLRDGKGLLSQYDKESLKMWNDLITSVRRNTAAVAKLKTEDQIIIKEKRENILIQMEEYRDKLEKGSNPQYLYDTISPIIYEHILAYEVRDVMIAPSHKQQKKWEELDIESIKKLGARAMEDVEKYTQQYNEASIELRQNMKTPEEWINYNFNKKCVKDKIWQIRTGHDTRSSLNAGINQKLNFIWDIPNITNETHRWLYLNNKVSLDSYVEWKKKNKTAKVNYDIILKKAILVLDSIIIPNF